MFWVRGRLKSLDDFGWPIFRPTVTPVARNRLQSSSMPLLRQLLFAILAFATLNVVLADAQTPSLLDPGASLVLTNLTVVDIRTGALHTSQTVVIDHDHIVAVSAAGSAKLTTKAERVDCTGLFAIPGLWDMHVHLSFGDWFPDAKEILLPLFIANGITEVRDMGSDLDGVQSWRSDINAGRLVGPRILTSGPMLDGPKPRFPSSVAIATPDDGRRAVADLKRHGADFIKLQSLIPR